MKQTDLFTMIHKAGPMERRILAERAELLEAAQKAVWMMEKAGIGFAETELRAAIKKAEATQ